MLSFVCRTIRFNIRKEVKIIKLHESGSSTKPLSLTRETGKPCCRYESKEIKIHFKSHLLIEYIRKTFEFCKIVLHPYIGNHFKHVHVVLRCLIVEDCFSTAIQKVNIDRIGCRMHEKFKFYSIHSYLMLHLVSN